MKNESFKLRIVLGRLQLILLVLVHSVLWAGQTSETDVKAAYLFNFAKFVEWPEWVFPTKTSPIVLGVLNDDQFVSALKGLEMKKIKGRSFSVVDIKNKDQIRTCHIVYFGDSTKKDIQDILNKFSDKPCLTVSDIEDFALKGGMIGFVRRGNNIRFEINLAAARQGTLTVSSRLLNLAQIVKN